jgi:hypothetical protein
MALLGSLISSKRVPKDADILIWIGSDVDLKKLAEVGRRLKGKAQSLNLGADIFLANSANEYLGRLCRFRDCHPRVACGSRVCGIEPYLCDDTHDFRLPRTLVINPPLDVWPVISADEIIKMLQ